MEIGENKIKGSTFSNCCFKDVRLGFASSSDVVEENNESIVLADQSLCSDSSEIVDDDENASSSSSSSSSSSRFMCSSSSSSLSSVSLKNLKGGPLYELSDLMAQLPIKRGLSKWYDGRSQSYTSLLTSVRSLEDLMKKERPYTKRLKLCRSYGGDLDLKPSNKVYHCPKATDFDQEDQGFQ